MSKLKVQPEANLLKEGIPVFVYGKSARGYRPAPGVVTDYRPGDKEATVKTVGHKNVFKVLVDRLSINKSKAVEDGCLTQEEILQVTRTKKGGGFVLRNNKGQFWSGGQGGRWVDKVGGAWLYTQDAAKFSARNIGQKDIEIVALKRAEQDLVRSALSESAEKEAGQDDQADQVDQLDHVNEVESVESVESIPNTLNIPQIPQVTEVISYLIATRSLSDELKDLIAQEASARKALAEAIEDHSLAVHMLVDAIK